MSRYWLINYEKLFFSWFSLFNEALVNISWPLSHLILIFSSIIFAFQFLINLCRSPSPSIASLFFPVSTSLHPSLSSLRFFISSSSFPLFSLFPSTARCAYETPHLLFSYSFILSILLFTLFHLYCASVLLKRISSWLWLLWSCAFVFFYSLLASLAQRITF